MLHYHTNFLDNDTDFLDYDTDFNFTSLIISIITV